MIFQITSTSSMHNPRVFQGHESPARPPQPSRKREPARRHVKAAYPHHHQHLASSIVLSNDSGSQAYVVFLKDRSVMVPIQAGAGMRDVRGGRGQCGRKQREESTYVALTSSFAGTGGIVEAMTSVACAGHKNEGRLPARKVQCMWREKS